MPPELGNPYPPRWGGIPPHMAPQDLLLWERARPQLAAQVTSWYFDAAVGQGNPAAGDPADKFNRAWERLTRKRIDAVGDAGSHWLIIEVRPNAGLGALGAIQTYRSLWERDPPDTRPAVGMIVTDRLEPDTHRTAINAGIQLLQV